MKSEDLLSFDAAHIWHPYTSMKDPLPTYPVASARGVRLILEDGTELIDGMSSWWAAIHGYGVPQLDAAV
ncbi:MAG: aminotransferase class III-fold pyridoxal phosphate-dependent enzyme, partial [Deltaproteobacteria bacterium]|nr:aminotransferase class III-fold pyridoxal phosphate-dependent enzyme [Deltaproteobacteria bacterium]